MFAPERPQTITRLIWLIKGTHEKNLNQICVSNKISDEPRLCYKTNRVRRKTTCMLNTFPTTLLICILWAIDITIAFRRFINKCLERIAVAAFWSRAHWLHNVWWNWMESRGVNAVNVYIEVANGLALCGQMIVTITSIVWDEMLVLLSGMDA